MNANVETVSLASLKTAAEGANANDDLSQTDAPHPLVTEVSADDLGPTPDVTSDTPESTSDSTSVQLAAQQASATSVLSASATLGDKFAQTISDIENASKTKAANRLKKLTENTSKDAFEIGGYLCRVQANKWFTPTYANFKDFVSGEMPFEYRTAMYMMSTYQKMSALDITWNQVSDIGWTKLSLVASYIVNAPDAKDAYLTMARDHSVVALKGKLAEVDANAAAAANPDQDMPPATPANPMKTVSTKVFEDQYDVIRAAMDTAKAGTGFNDAQALEALALSYTQQGAVGDVSLAAFESAEDVVKAMQGKWPNISVSLSL